MEKVEQNPPTRFEAQRSLGLFATHDYISVALLLVSWISWVLVYTLSPEVPWKLIGGWAIGNVVLAQVWIVILVYRGLVFTLDLHAEIALMPESAARIAAGYFEGRVKGSK